tara:strand:- start:13833 stop:14051 length:219 start_codon:yes stop_codon:yes gene_type:complete
MLDAIAFGMDETALAYDMQRAHSADVWFLRARFYFWGIIGCLTSFTLGQLMALTGINILGELWEGFWALIYH